MAEALWTWGLGFHTAARLREYLAEYHSPIPEVLPHLDYTTEGVQYDSLDGDDCGIQRAVQAALARVHRVLMDEGADVHLCATDVSTPLASPCAASNSTTARQLLRGLPVSTRSAKQWAAAVLDVTGDTTPEGSPQKSNVLFSLPVSAAGAAAYAAAHPTEPPPIDDEPQSDNCMDVSFEHVPPAEDRVASPHSTDTEVARDASASPSAPPDYVQDDKPP